MLSISKRFSGFTDSGCQAFSELDYHQEFYYFNCYQVFSSNPENLGAHKPGFTGLKIGGFTRVFGCPGRLTRVAFPSTRRRVVKNCPDSLLSG